MIKSPYLFGTTEF